MAHVVAQFRYKRGPIFTPNARVFELSDGDRFIDSRRSPAASRIEMRRRGIIA